MDDSVKNRTIEFVKHKGITMKSFENKCGLSSGYVTSMRKGFGSNKLSNVLKAYPELNRDWLLYGEGPMLKIDIGSYTPSESKSETVTVSREAWDIIKRQAESLERKDAQISDLISILKKINAQQDAPAACADAN